MPVSYRFDDRIVVLSMEGSYQVEELQACLLACFADPELPSDAVLLFDQRRSTSLKERGPDEVRRMAEFLKDHKARFGCRIAMVTASPVGYGLMRMGSAYVELGGVQPFVTESLEDARAWLLPTAEPGAGEPRD